MNCPRHKRCALAAVGALLVVAMPPAPATAGGLSDSPWPMFQHDPQHTGRSAVAAPSRLGLKWRFQVEGQPGSPAIGADGTIYLPVGSATGFPPDAKGFLYAINPDGTLRWRFEIPPNPICVIVPGVTTPAIAADGTIYLHTQSGRTPDGSANCIAGPSFLYAINPNGTKKWEYQLNAGAAVFVGKGLSSPVVGDDGTIYLGSRDTGLYALNPNGTEKWIDSPALTSISSSPAIGPDGTVYVTLFDLHAYGPDGDPKWTAELGDGCCIGSSPSVAPDGTIHACGINPSACHAVRPTGSIKWSHPIRITNETSPAVGADGAIYLASGDESANTLLTALNADGSLRWQNTYAIGKPGIDHSPAIGGDGRIYGRSDLDAGSPPGFSGSIFATNPDGSENHRVNIPPVSGGAGELNMAIGADGTLYVPEPTYGTTATDNPADQYLAAYVQAPPPPAGSGSIDSRRPGLSLGGRKRQRLDAAVEVRASCDEPCTVAGKGTLVAGGRRFRLKKATAQLAARTKTLKLKLPGRARRAGRKALRRGRKVTAKVTVTATDAARNRTTRKRTIRLGR